MNSRVTADDAEDIAIASPDLVKDSTVPKWPLVFVVIIVSLLAASYLLKEWIPADWPIVGSSSKRAVVGSFICEDLNGYQVRCTKRQ